MSIFDSPFYKLGVSTRTRKTEIFSAAEERNLLSGDDEAREMANCITNPVTRLAAEIAWFPGVSPRDIDVFLHNIKTSPDLAFTVKPFSDSTILFCAKSNALAEKLSLFTDELKDECVENIVELALSFDIIDVERLMNYINSDRIVAGIAEIDDVDKVKFALDKHIVSLVEACKVALDNFDTDDLIYIVTELVDETTEWGTERAPNLVYGIVDTYEVGTQGFFAKATPAIEKLIDNIKERSDTGGTLNELNIYVNKLINMTKQWDNVAQPIQVAMQSKSLEHEPSRDLANSLRDLALHLFNKHSHLKLSQKITAAISEIFAEVYSAADDAQRDLDTLKEIAEDRTKDNAELEEERRYMNYSAEIGLVFKNHVKITSEYIEFDGAKMLFADVEHVAWGGMRKSVNGIPTGTTYTISMLHHGDKVYCISFSGNKNVYSNIIDRVWRAVAIRITVELIESLKKGNKRNFGDSVVSDDRISLCSHGWFSSKREDCLWTDVRISCGPGYFQITSAEDNSLYTQIDYMRTYDTHILEQMLRVGFKKGIRKLSDVLR